MQHPQAGHRVLVVEDDWNARWLLASAFERRDIDADVAESGREAMTLLKHNPAKYCTMILDLNIPPPNGIEIAQFVTESIPALPVIVVSGHADLTEKLACAGLDEVVKLIIVKPVAADVLVGHVRGFCTNSGHDR